MDSAFKLVYKRMGIQNLKGSIPFLVDAPDYSFVDVVGVIYPRVFEIYVLTWAICLETGWSKEMVERIDHEDYLYSPIPIESDVVFIKTTKERGIDGESDIAESKEYIYPNSKSNQKSAYNLIRTYVQRSKRLRTGIHYRDAVKQLGKEPFFIYFNESPGLPILFIHPDKVSEHSAATKNRFLESNIGFRFDVRRLRPTCLLRRERDQNLPMVLQVALFGHSTSAVTDEYYKDSSEFQQLRKDKLAIELNQIEKSISDGSFKGTLAPLKQKKRKEDAIITIFTEHSNHSPIATCGNNKAPDWPGYEQQLKVSGVCKRFDKCLLCSQSTVFNDNIPFLVDRYLYLEQQKRTLRQDTFVRLHGDEYSAVKEVVHLWPYREEIEEAEDRTLIEGYMLPPIIMETNI